MFQCSRCLKTFPINSRLIRHINSKKICKLHPDGNDLTKIELNALAYENKRVAPIHKCTKCNKTFSSNSQLQRHILKCNGIGCFLKQKLRLPDEWKKYHNKPKNLLKAIFYNTFIDNPNLKIKLIKNIDGKYYKLYIDNKWSGRVTKYTILNKFLYRILGTKSQYLNKTIKSWCKYWIDLNISDDKALETIMKHRKYRFSIKAGGRSFYKLILDDIMLAVDGGIETVKQFNIFGMIKYQDYVNTHLNEEIKLAEKKLENHLQEQIKLKKQEVIKDLDSDINSKKKYLEKIYFKQNANIKIYQDIDHIINNTDMSSEDDIIDMEQSIECIMEKYLVSRKIQMDIYYYLENKHPSISFYHVYKKLDY